MRAGMCERELGTLEAHGAITRAMKRENGELLRTYLDITVEGNSKAIKSISMQMGFLCEEIIGLLSIKVSSENNNHGRQAGRQAHRRS